MKFKLKTCRARYSESNFNIDVYRKYGFEFNYDQKWQEYVIKLSPELEIDSIEKLIEMKKDFDKELIISDKSITIYDSWIE